MELTAINRREGLDRLDQGDVKLLVVRGHFAHALFVALRHFDMNAKHAGVARIQRGCPLFRRPSPKIAQIVRHGTRPRDRRGSPHTSR